MINWRMPIGACLFGSMLIAGSAAAQTLRVGLADDPDVLDPDAVPNFGQRHRPNRAVR
jgi:hypothetical protein